MNANRSSAALKANSNMKTSTLARVMLIVALWNTPTAGAVGGVQLDYVALDASAQCNRIFFRSSQHYKNTIFVAPRVVPGPGPQGKRLYDIAATEEAGEYILSLRLYFPANDEQIKGRSASRNHRDLDACNWDLVKASINRHARNEDEKVLKISRMPLTSIEVALPGIAEIGRIGRSKDATEESDILYYYGSSLTAFFKINEKERALFLQQVVNPDGLAAQIKMRFQAQSRNGSVNATVDVKSVQANFAAAAKGKVKMTKAEVKTSLRASMTSSSIQVTSEAGKNGSLEKIEAMVMEQVMKEMAAAVEALPSETPQADAGDDTLVSVSAVMNALASKVSKQISFQQIAAPESATAQTEIKLKSARINDPNLFEIEMQAHFPDPTTPFVVQAGQTFTITPSHSYIEKIEYVESKSFLSAGQLQEMELHRQFPNIVAPNVHITNREVNGVLMAVGSWYPFNLALNAINYRWIRTERFPERTRTKQTRFAPTMEGLAKIPVSVSFTAMGDRYAFQVAELIGDRGFFEGHFDAGSGRIIISAKQNLGAVRFVEQMTSAQDVAYSDDPIVMDSVVEERNPFFRQTVSAPVVLKKDDDALILQKTIVFNVTRPYATPVGPMPTPVQPVTSPTTSGVVSTPN